MKKQALAAAVLLSTLLASALAGALVVNLAAANPVFLPMKVNLTSPQNRTYTQTTVPVAFTYGATEVDRNRPPDSLPQSYTYKLDGQERVRFYPEFRGGAYRSTISGLSNGVYNLTIYVAAATLAIHYTGSSTVTFTVDTAPRVSVLSPENGTYDTADVPLDFVVKKPFSSVAYCLDGLANVTVSGNATLSGLSSGVHTVTVYAWDEVGNVGASETIMFTIALFPTSKLIAASTVALIAVMCFGLLAYFIKFKRKKP